MIPRRIMLLALLLCYSYISLCSSQCLSSSDNPDDKNTRMNLFEASDFGLNLFKKLYAHNRRGNTLFSPYSIWNILSLAYLGSGGNTEIELKTALRVNSQVIVLKKWTSFEYVYKLRQLSSEDLKFKISTKAFVDGKLSLRDCLKHILADELDFMQVVDFSLVNETTSKINGFISDSTKGKINDMVTQSDLDMAKMVFVSAAYFKDSWKMTFDPSKTKDEVFYISVQNISFVPMMRQKGYFKHGMSEEIGAHVLELPYALKSISMFIFLPPFFSGDEGFNRMIEKLTGPALKRATEDIWAGHLDVILPKFRIDSSFGDELTESLKAMGIKDLFDPIKANLTGYVPEGGISIDKTMHKAFIEVSEEGTEAAGAGVAIATARSSRPLTSEAFECNHPFAFVIYDKLLDNILFVGTYKEPNKIIRI